MEIVNAFPALVYGVVIFRLTGNFRAASVSATALGAFLVLLAHNLAA